MPKFLKLSLLLVVPLMFFRFAFAADVKLTHIGSLDLGDNMYTEWWYSVENPTLKGVAPSGTKVTVKVDDKSTEVTADGSGNWSVPTSTPKGDYSITVTATGYTYSFKLHSGQLMTSMESAGDSESSASSTVPSTGSNQILLIFSSLVLISAGYTMFKMGSVRREFEKSFIDKN